MLKIVQMVVYYRIRGGVDLRTVDLREGRDGEKTEEEDEIRANFTHWTKYVRFGEL